MTCIKGHKPDSNPQRCEHTDNIFTPSATRTFPPYLFVVGHQVCLELPLRPVLRQLVVGDLSQVEVGYLGGGPLHPAAGGPLWVGLPLGLLSLLFLILLGGLGGRVGGRERMKIVSFQNKLSTALT